MERIIEQNKETGLFKYIIVSLTSLLTGLTMRKIKRLEILKNELKEKMAQDLNKL